MNFFKPKPKKIPKHPQKIEIIESEPEQEEIVHIIHKSKKVKEKDQLLYIEDEDEEINQYPRFRQKIKSQDIMYVSRSPSPQQKTIKFINSKEKNQNVLYSIPKLEKKQIVYVKESRPLSPINYIYRDPDLNDMLPYDNSFSHNEHIITNKERKIPNYIYYDEQTSRNKKIYYVNDRN